MSNVIQLHERQERIWICGCGCSTFNLVEGGAAECAACGKPVDGGGWVSKPADASEYEGETFSDVQGNGSVEFARRRIEQKACDHDAVLIAVVKRDGTISAWTEAQEKKQIAWVKSRLRDIGKMIEGAR